MDGSLIHQSDHILPNKLWLFTILAVLTFGN
jgi:hypothetical protein